MMKKIIVFSVLTILLSSCCPFAYFVPQDKIAYSNSHAGDTLGYAFGVVNIRRTNHKDHCDLLQAIKTNAPTLLNKKDITIYQDGKPLKFDLRVAQPDKWVKVKKDTVTLQEQSLFVLSTKAKTAPGQTLTVVERNYPCLGDSIVVHINLDDVNKSPGSISLGSMVGQMLPRIHTLEGEANQFAKVAVDMMEQMQNQPDSTKRTP